MKKTLRTTKKILHIKLTIAVLLLLPLVVLTFVTSKTDKLMGLRSMVVLTGSMTPKLPVGSVVYVQKAADYTVGDVISFTNESHVTVTHRIVNVQHRKDGLAYIVKGDANKTSDLAAVPVGNVIGKAVFSIPYLGYAVGFLKTLKGFILAIVLPILIFIGFELWNIKKEIEVSVEKRVREQFAAHE